MPVQETHTIFESHPDTHVNTTDVSNPDFAYDNDTSTYASFSRNQDGYFEVGGFTVNGYSCPPLLVPPP